VGCSTCGKSARFAKPGGAPRNPIILGESNDEPAQAVTFTVDYEVTSDLKVSAGEYRYVSGTGVDDAVEKGDLTRGFPQRQQRARQQQRPRPTPRWYVESDRGSFVGFSSRPAADRYAKTTGKVVLTKDEVLKGESS